VLGHDPAPVDAVPAGVAMTGFEELLGRSGIVSVHARATPGNRHLFGAAEFARMRRGSFFINTARESLVDEDALQQALVSGALAGAALDVAERRRTWSSRRTSAAPRTRPCAAGPRWPPGRWRGWWPASFRTIC